MVLEQGLPGIAVGTAWGRGCGSTAHLAGSKRPLTPRGQGLQGIRAGLIRLGWIRGQGKQPVVQGGRFSMLGTHKTWHEARPRANPRLCHPKGGLVLMSQPGGNLA